jgi:light-regulated signal transduction histidine kinase (bacteriophytochrome)
MELLVEMKAYRKADQEKAEDDREELEEMRKARKEDIKSSQAEIRSTIFAIQSELEETIQHDMKGDLSYVDQKAQNLCMKLMETIEKTQMELQTVAVFFDKRTRDVEEKVASITEDTNSNKRKF